MNGAVRLADYPGELILVVCRKCDRRGQYRRANLVAKYGPDMGLPDVLHVLAGDCPKWSGWDRCGAVYPELADRVTISPATH